MNADDFARAREEMVRLQIARRGIVDKRVLEAMGRVPRHEFVNDAQRAFAYDDHPLPIGHGQTISQPYIVAYMTQALRARRGSRILEIGSGCGYQSAVLAHMGAKVFAVEIVEPLLRRMVETMAALGYAVSPRLGDGRAGLPEEAPFDGVLVAAASPDLPAALVDQLKEGGRLVIPVGTEIQDLKTYEKRDDELLLVDTLPVRFVPLV